MPTFFNAEHLKKKKKRMNAMELKRKKMGRE
jgi:hypothetical protein